MMSVPELLTCQDVMKITGIRSRTTIWRRVQAGNFPLPIDFGAGRIRWNAADVTEWVNSRPKRRY
jgi:prophage regulatory protein